MAKAPPISTRVALSRCMKTAAKRGIVIPRSKKKAVAAKAAPAKAVKRPAGTPVVPAKKVAAKQVAARKVAIENALAKCRKTCAGC